MYIHLHLLMKTQHRRPEKKRERNFHSTTLLEWFYELIPASSFLFYDFRLLMLQHPFPQSPPHEFYTSHDGMYSDDTHFHICPLGLQVSSVHSVSGCLSVHQILQTPSSADDALLSSVSNDLEHIKKDAGHQQQLASSTYIYSTWR